MSDEPTGRDAFVAAVEELRRRVASVHERVACPVCGAPVGERCRRVQRAHTGAGPAPAGLPPGVPLKSAHNERLRADGIPDR